MGFSARTLALIAIVGALTVSGSAQAAIPGPPLAGGAPEAGAFCPAQPSAAGPWNAAAFGAAVVGVGLLARRRGARA